MLESLPSLAEYGIAIFTVGVTLFVVRTLITRFIDHTETQTEKFSSTVTDLADRHERERSVWSQAEGQRLERTDKVLSELREAIQESIKHSKEGKP